MCGQDGSTANFGTSTFDARRGGLAEARCDPAIPSATTAAKATTALNHKFRLDFISADPPFRRRHSGGETVPSCRFLAFLKLSITVKTDLQPKNP
jgi:hypothetical protein